MVGISTASEGIPQAPAREHPRLGYQPALDGLRAVAVLAVLLYHGGVSWAAGGFLGVDVFFVLSGFLITSLLVAEWAGSGRISVLTFYGRRARRLFPALAVVLVAVAAYAVLLAPTSQLRQLRGDFLATLAYVMNWRLVLEDRGYFDAFTGPSPLQHTWSLAVEEQWYLLWPLVLGGMLKMASRRRRGLGLPLALTGALCAASALWAAVLFRPGTDPSRVYYGTDTRAHELLAGAVLALVCATAGRFTLPARRRSSLVAVGAAALLWVMWLAATVDARTTWLYDGGLLAISVGVGAVILAAIQPDGVVRRVLSLRPLRLVGLISYGLYLWHFPVYVVLSAERTGLSGSSLLLLRLAVTAGASVVSYHLVERPVRDGRVPVPTLVAGGTLAIVGALVAVVLVTAAVPLAATGAPAILPPPPAVAEAGVPPTAPPEVYDPVRPEDYFIYQPELNPPPSTVPGEPAVRVLVTGESVARTISEGFLQRSGHPPTLLWDTSVVGCPLFAAEREFDGVRTDGGPQCAEWRRDRTRWLADFDPDVVAVLSGVWETYDKVVDGDHLEFGSDAFDDWFSDELDRLVHELSANGARVVLLTVPCNDREEGITGAEPPENQAERIAHVNDLYRQGARRNGDDAAIVDLHGFVCPGGIYQDRLGEIPLRTDGVHFTREGAEIVRTWLYPRLASLAR
ncbi:MAG: acyltransferase family protein [Acidimicrobiales bacterium]